MTTGWFLPLLAVVTIGLGIFFALRSKAKVKERKADPDAPKSSLAKDGPGPQPFR